MKNEAAAALARKGVKKHPHLHSKDRMKELVKIRAEKRANKEEPALVKPKLKKGNMLYEP